MLLVSGSLLRIPCCCTWKSSSTGHCLRVTALVLSRETIHVIRFDVPYERHDGEETVQTLPLKLPASISMSDCRRFSRRKNCNSRLSKGEIIVGLKGLRRRVEIKQRQHDDFGRKSMCIHEREMACSSRLDQQTKVCWKADRRALSPLLDDLGMLERFRFTDHSKKSSSMGSIFVGSLILKLSARPGLFLF